jgi:hypothetical protein
MDALHNRYQQRNRQTINANDKKRKGRLGLTYPLAQAADPQFDLGYTAELQRVIFYFLKRPGCGFSSAAFYNKKSRKPPSCYTFSVIFYDFFEKFAKNTSKAVSFRQESEKSGLKNQKNTQSGQFLLGSEQT